VLCALCCAVQIGCGPGYFAEQLLLHIPRAELWCIDINVPLLDFTRANHSDLIAAGRLHVVEDSALTLSQFTDLAFDVVFTRLILQHLPHWDACVETVWRVLRPGGLYFAMDAANGDFVWPRVPLTDKLTELFAQYRAKFHGANDAARELPRVLLPKMRAVGFVRLHVDGVVAASQAYGEEDGAAQRMYDLHMPLLDPVQYFGLVRANWLSLQDWQDARRDWLDTFRRPDTIHQFMMLGLCLMYSGHKPAAAGIEQDDADGGAALAAADPEADPKLDS
jgi:SAM-dependent methyltransferase